MRYKKITELPEFRPDFDNIQAMAVLDNKNTVHRINIGEFDCTNEEDAIQRVKESIKQHGHVLVIPYKPL